jgi:hypothetical protein
MSAGCSGPTTALMPLGARPTLPMRVSSGSAVMETKRHKGEGWVSTGPMAWPIPRQALRPNVTPDDGVERDQARDGVSVTGQAWTSICAEGRRDVVDGRPSGALICRLNEPSRRSLSRTPS